jgi:hypothetical protein
LTKKVRHAKVISHVRRHMSDPKFQVGQTYDARRGRKIYTVEEALEQAGTWSYTVTTIARLSTHQSLFLEEDLLSVARLTKKGSKVWLSASQINTFRACPRKWAYTYIDGETTPTSDSMLFGTEVHSVLEEYLKTGEWVGAPDAIACAKQGLASLPGPDSRLGLEQRFTLPLFNGAACMLGFIDLVVPPGVDGQPHLEVGDHKTTVDLRYALDREGLKKDVQCNIYCKWAKDKYDVGGVLAKWRYYCARKSRAKSADEAGRPRSASGFREVSRYKEAAEIEEQWAEILKTAEEMVSYASNPEVWADDVRGCSLACGDYGGCPFRGRCHIETETLGELMGHMVSQGEGGAAVSLMDVINQRKKEEEEREAATTKVVEAALKKAKETPPDDAPLVGEPELPKEEAKSVLADILAGRGVKQVLTGVNPPPVEQTELPATLVEEEKPTVPQAWIDRLAKGHKTRAEGEAEWRAEQAATTKTETMSENSVKTGQSPTLTGASRDTEEASSMEKQKADKRGTEKVTLSEKLTAVKDDPTLSKMSTTEDTATATLADTAPDIMPDAKKDTKTPSTTWPNERCCGEGKESSSEGFLTVCLDCLPIGPDSKRTEATGNPGDCVYLSAYLDPLKRVIEEKHQVSYWNLLKYREGETILAGLLKKTFAEIGKPLGYLVVDTRLPEWKAVGDVVLSFADVVIAGRP